MLVPVAILPFLAADVANIGLPVRLLHVLRHLRLGAKLFAVIAPLEVRNVFLVVGVFQHLELGVKLLGALRARRVFVFQVPSPVLRKLRTVDGDPAVRAELRPAAPLQGQLDLLDELGRPERVLEPLGDALADREPLGPPRVVHGPRERPSLEAVWLEA